MARRAAPASARPRSPGRSTDRHALGPSGRFPGGGSAEQSVVAHEARRLIASEPNRILAYTLEVEIIEKQKRIYYFAKRIAKTVAEEPPDEPAPDNRDPN